MPELALSHIHLKHLAKHILKLDPGAPILLLLSRDIIRANKVRKQLNGPHNSPYAQKLSLGWVIVCNVYREYSQTCPGQLILHQCTEQWTTLTLSILSKYLHCEGDVL